MLVYRGYIAHIEFDDEAGLFHGEVINTKDVITFQGTSAAELKKAFVDSVGDYLAFCKERGEAPEKPFSGKFNLRLTPDLHRRAYLASRQQNESLNQWVIDAIYHHLPLQQRG